MKFLVVATPNGTPVPPEMGAQLYKDCTKWMTDQFAAGKMECHYSFVDTGGFAIGMADSAEEMFFLITSYPMFGFYDWDVSALCEWELIYAGMIKKYESMA